MPSTTPVTFDRLAECERTVRSALLAERNEGGWWTGELSTSALSTATAVMAIETVRRARAGEARDLTQSIARGLAWLAEHQNDDGGWGDTKKSISNISTTMLAHAAFHAAGDRSRYSRTIDRAQGYIERAGGIPAVVARYGTDKTFSIPILTHCALAGLVDWREVQPLPFELACLPHRFYSTVRMPVVSYALPALIAIGQVRHFHRKPRNPLARLVRRFAARPSLAKLEAIQPTSGGFLEAAPLTSFVTMSLAGMGLADHPVAVRGLEFLLKSVRPDGSWPIDTNLATWVTTLSVNALGDDLPGNARGAVRSWLLAQQYRDVHLYTNAAPGGWAWTDLPGGVPDADDTPGAILALLNLGPPPDDGEDLHNYRSGLALAATWLADLQNSDGGWPTFCRGWGNLPFDRSAPDLSAHAIRALSAWLDDPASRHATETLRRRCAGSIRRGFAYLARSQQADGSWLPLWFGNQFVPGDINPAYGTARVLAAYRAAGTLDDPAARRALDWLKRAQNDDGGWGGAEGIDSSVEETALAVEILASAAFDDSSAVRGLAWLVDRVEAGTYVESSPIGFYFAKLWYFERLYPLIFTTAALRRAVGVYSGDAELETRSRSHHERHEKDT